MTKTMGVRMRRRPVVQAVVAAMLASSAPAAAFADPAARVFGYVDAAGAFRAEPAVPAALPAAISVANGKIALTLFITIASDTAHMPRANPVRCGLFATITSTESAADLGIKEADWVTASISASRATCRLVIPYSWELATRGGDRVILSYIVSSQSDLVATSPLTSANGRSFERTLGSYAIPANGGTITVVKSVTL